MVLIDASVLARKLYKDLHSSADENFVSTLLVGALNENAKFRKWFAIERGGLHGGVGIERFVAITNGTLPRCIAGKKTADNVYRRPDLCLWDPRQEALWDRVEKRKNASGEDLRKLRALFVEMKWSFVSDADRAKYTNFVAKLAPLKRMKFVLILGLENVVVDRIRRTASNNWERTIKKLVTNRYIRVITQCDLYDSLRKSVKLVSQSRQPATMLALKYFEILTRREALEYWRFVVEEYPDSDDVREELLIAVSDIAVQTGYTTRPLRLRRWRSVSALYMTFQERAKVMGYDETQLVVSLEGDRFSFGLVSRKAAHLSQTLGKIRKAMEKRVATG